jgi:hypothetical protein
MRSACRRSAQRRRSECSRGRRRVGTAVSTAIAGARRRWSKSSAVSSARPGARALVSNKRDRCNLTAPEIDVAVDGRPATRWAASGGSSVRRRQRRSSGCSTSMWCHRVAFAGRRDPAIMSGCSPSTALRQCLTGSECGGPSGPVAPPCFNHSGVIDCSLGWQRLVSDARQISTRQVVPAPVLSACCRPKQCPASWLTTTTLSGRAASQIRRALTSVSNAARQGRDLENRPCPEVGV